MNQRKFYNQNVEEYLDTLDKPRETLNKKEFFDTINCENKSVLDLGCGNGDILEYIGEYKTYLGVDYSDKLVEKAIDKYSNQNTGFMQGNIKRKLKIGEKFDIIIFNYIIHHTNFSPIKIAKNYLKDGGIIIVNEPILKNCKGKNVGYVWLNKPIKEKKNVQINYERRYDLEHPKDFEFSVKELTDFVEKNGFRVVKESSRQFNVIPFINRTNNWWLLKLNKEIEKLLLFYTSRIRLEGTVYSVVIEKDFVDPSVWFLQ